MGFDLDLTTVGDDRIAGIECIDLTSGVANGVTLKAADVIAMTDDANTLFIDGDSAAETGTAADTALLIGSWTPGPPAAGFDVFTLGSATVNVDADIEHHRGGLRQRQIESSDHSIFAHARETSRLRRRCPSASDRPKGTSTSFAPAVPRGAPTATTSPCTAAGRRPMALGVGSPWEGPKAASDALRIGCLARSNNV